ncbi:MAG TPA: CopG family transcriptional regulator [Thermoanaerobaculia bacterium]|nr:CopG family transcriptional regulator [Thermoanaerobaculia bacterium]
MIRTQIQLTREQEKALKELANREQRSLASVVRDSVDEYLIRHRAIDRQELRERVEELAGAYRSGTRDLAEDHDRHLDDAYDPAHSSNR